jgi:tetratricopeptide (TPR) repeat protein
MTLNPLRADTVTAFASGLIKKKRFGEAERYLQTVIRENPNFAPAHYQLALVFNARRKLVDAKRHFLRAILEDDTAFPEANRYLGYIFREQRLDREAKRYFRRYLQLADENAAERPEIERLLGLKR